MSSNTKKKIKSRKLFSGIVIVVLLLAVTAAGILYVKIYEPGKRSADLGRLQQESYQGVFCSMYAPEALGSHYTNPIFLHPAHTPQYPQNLHVRFYRFC